MEIHFFFIDLIDQTNQFDIYQNNEFANDWVEGYSLFQLQKALNYHTTLDGVGDYLRNNFSNSTENGISTIVTYYEGIKEEGKK